MPIKTPHTKAQKQAVVKTEMNKFKGGKLHSGSKHGPVVTNPKQAIAISLSESGQSKKPPPRGGGESKPGYDRSGHRPGNPGFAEGKHVPNQSYAQEQKEHWGSKAEGKPMAKHAKIANIDHDNGALISKHHGDNPHHEQTGGKSIGVDHNEGAEHHKGHSMGGAPHSFKPPAAQNSHGYGHSSGQRKGTMRMSGHPGAHRLGCK